MIIRKFSSIVLVLILVLGTSTPVFAIPSSEITVILYGKTMIFDQPPIVENGRTLVPFRSIFEAFDAEVDWNKSTQAITAKRGDTTIIMQIGNTVMKVDEGEITLDVAPKILHGRTFVPLRTVSEALGADVGWDQANSTIVIGKAGTDWYALPQDLRQASDSKAGDIWVRDPFTGAWILTQ